MTIKDKLKHLTDRELFANYYLENLLPETDTWNSVDHEEMEEVFQELKEL